MEFLAKGFRNFLATIVAWMDKADQEQEEQVQELLKPPNSDLLPHGVKRGEDGSLHYDLDAAEEQARQDAAAQRAQSPAAQPRRTSETPAAPRPPLPPVAGGAGPAGLRVRQRGETPSSNRIVQNTRNDTEYRERDAVVRLIEEKYSHLPPSVSAAVLSRVLAPDGMARLLGKLGMESLGLADPDHEQVLDYINENGLEEFCRAAGIRYDSERMNHSSRRAKGPLPKATPAKRTVASESRQRRAAAPSDHRVSLDADKVKPVDLRKKSEDE